MEPDRKKNKLITKKPMTYKNTKAKEEDSDGVSSHENLEFEITKLAAESLPEPDYDEEDVLLSWYDSDLNLVIDENFTAASPLHDKGFCYLQAGARATYGFFEEKVCFEVKVLQCCKLSIRKGHLNSHLLRVGWSPRRASLALGSDHKSYGFDNTGRATTIGEIVDYGTTFTTGDVVGAYLDLDDNSVTVSFTVNGKDMGVAYEIPQTDVQKEPLFPHILTKNVSYECNFKGEKPWFPPKEGYTFVADVAKKKRIAGPKRPKSKSDCEVIMMVGLPKSGKTTWVNEFREKNPGTYYVIDTGALVDKMEAMDPERKALILRKTRVMGKLLGIAMDRRRNYILDQANVVRSEQIWKMDFFRNYKRRIVAVVVSDEELVKRIKKMDERSLGDLSWLLLLKAKFMLPTQKCLRIAAVTDKIDYIGLPEDEALQLVKSYNREAWRLGFKPYKNFVIPSHLFKEKREKMPKGSWMSRVMADPRNADFPGTAPPRARTSGDWSPSRNRGNDEWQSPSRNRNSGEWHSPSRKRMSGDWPSPSRGRGQEQWLSPDRNRPGGSGLRSPPRGRMDDSWHPDARKRRYSPSPPRDRPGDRWNPRGGIQSPPRSRMDDWQLRRGRSPGDRNSPLRRRPDVSPRFPGQHSPPRGRVEEQHLDRSRFQIREGSGGWHPDERGRQTQGNPDRGNWPLHEARMGGEFPLLGGRGDGGGAGGGAFPQERRIDEGILPESRMDDSMPHHEHRLSGNLPLQEAGMGGGFPRGDGRMGGHMSSPPRRMDDEFMPREGRFGGDLPHREERIGDVSHPREGRMGSDILPQERRMRGAFPPQEGRPGGGFALQNNRMGAGQASAEGRGPIPPMEGRMPTQGRGGNDFVPPESRMVGGMPLRDRLSDVPPREARPARSSSPHEKMMGDSLPNEGRIHENLPSMRARMSGGRMDNNVPQHIARMGRDVLAPAGRMGGSLSRENRFGDSPPHSGRMIGDLPSQEHRMSGDLPRNEGRMGDNFSHHEGRSRDILPPPGGRRGGDIPHHEVMVGGPLPPREGRMGNDIPLREGRLGGDFPPHEGRIGGGMPPHGGRIESGDLPPRGRRIGDDDLPPHGGRIGDLPPGGRIGSELMPGGKGDIPPRGGRIGGDMPPLGSKIGEDLPPGGRMMSDLPPGRRIGDLPSGGRMGSDMPPHGGRMGGDFPSNSGRVGGDLPAGGRIGSGDFLLRGGKVGGDLPPGERIGGDLPPHGGRVGGDMPPHGGRVGSDMPPHGGRVGSDMPPHGGRVAGDIPPLGRRFGGDMPPRGGRFGGDMAPQGGRLTGDMPPHGGRFGDLPPLGGRLGGDLPPRGGRFGGDLPPQEVRMPGDPQLPEGRSGSSDRWNRLPPNNDRPMNFGPPVKQEWLGEQQQFSSNKGMGGREGNTIRHSRWSSPSRDVLLQSIKSEPPDNAEKSGSGPDFRFQEDRENINCQPGSSGRQPLQGRGERGLPGSWKPQDGRSSERASLPDIKMEEGSQQFQQNRVDNRERVGIENRFRDNKRGSPNRAPGNWPSPSRGRRPGAPSPSRPGCRSPSPVGRNQQRSPVGSRQNIQPSGGRPTGRPRGDQRSPVGGGGVGWQPPGDRHSGDWQSAERVNLGSQGERGLPGNEPRVGPHSAPFDGRRLDVAGPARSGGQFAGVDDTMNETGPGGWQAPGRGPPEGWQSPGSGSAGGGRWERRVLIVPEEENEELAPYEVPFNQADWDSSEPISGDFGSAGNNRPGRNDAGPSGPLDDRSRGNNAGQHQEPGGRSGSKNRASVWQRVGGYVDDKKERGPGDSRFPERNIAGGDAGRGRGRDIKEVGRDFEEGRNRRGHDERDIPSDKRPRLEQRRPSPYRGDRRFMRGSPRGSPRGHWRSPGRKPRGRW